MKKVFFLSAIAALALASCTSDDFLGTPNPEEGGIKAIAFGGSTAKNTRAGEITGSSAATLLGNNFVVEGVKGNGTTQTEVFDHYNVNYKASTANTTVSNTNNWEYVGQEAHTLSNLETISQKQTIKYWDYSATQYDFVAFSYGSSDNNELTLTEIKYSNIGNDGVDHTSDDPAGADETEAVYTVTGSAEELAKAYIADLVTLYNRDGVNDYGTTVVTPKFRSMGTKVRLAFYETVSGYAVSNVKFYDVAWDETDSYTETSSATPTLFAANAIFPSATTTGTMNVYYPTVGWANSANDGDDPDYNQAHITFTAGSGSGEDLVTTKEFDELEYTASAEANEKCTDILGRSSSTATYAGDVTAANHAYEIVLPLGTKDNIQIRIEYDLYPIDGGAEVIHVKDARAVVPAEYCEWKPNYAYTYIFKISDNTNGWTGVDGAGNVTEGLTPITFDAVVVDTEDGIQETITTVATPSITTYSYGVQPTATAEYATDKNIYISLEDPSTATLTTSNSKLYTATIEGGAAQTINEESVANAIENGALVVAADDVTARACVATPTDPQIAAGDDVSSYYLKNADGNYVKCGATETAVEGTTYYELDPDDATGYVVKDANGKKLTVTVSSLLSIEDEIAATDAPDGNAIEGNFAKFNTTDAGTYVFEYNDGAKKHYKIIIVH